MGDLTDYLIGDKGVQLTGSPIHTPDGGLLMAQNVEFIREQGMGGIGSRRALTPLNATALAGSVSHIANLPFGYPSNEVLMIALSSGEAGLSFLLSKNGTTFTETVATTAAVRMFDTNELAAIPGGIMGSNSLVWIPAPGVKYRNKYYYPSGDYVLSFVTGPVGTSAPLNQFDGTIGLELFRVPLSPNQAAATSVPYIVNIEVIDGLIYLCVHDSNVPGLGGRVLAFDPENGTLTQIGNRFGSSTGEAGGVPGAPYSICSFNGRLFVGEYSTLGNNVWSILPNSETTWTLDKALASGIPVDLCEYNGVLYVGTLCNAAGSPIVYQRTGAGVWSTALTGAAKNVSHYAGLIVFRSNLYFSYTALSGGVPQFLHLLKFDGASWTTDKDLSTDYTLTTNHSFRKPFIYKDALYYPLRDQNTAHMTSFLLKLTGATGVYSQVATGRSILGGLGSYKDPTADAIPVVPPVVSGPFTNGFSNGFGA